VVTSSDDQFWANSIIIEGIHEVMLVDAQLTKTNAERVLQEIKATRKRYRLSTSLMSTPTIFLVWRFQGGLSEGENYCEFCGSRSNQQGLSGEIDKWKKLLSSDAASHVVGISNFDPDAIEFGDSKIQVFKHIRGDTDENTMPLDSWTENPHCWRRRVQ